MHVKGSKAFFNKLPALSNAGPTLPDADFEAQVEVLALRIEGSARTATFDIAPTLAEVHQLFLHNRSDGGFRRWVAMRLEYSRTSAYRLLDVAGLMKVPQWDTFKDLPMRAIYALAASSTPESAREAVLEHLKTGAHLTHVDVDKIIASAKPTKTRDNVVPFGSGTSGERIESIQTDEHDLTVGADEHGHLTAVSAAEKIPSSKAMQPKKKAPSLLTAWEATPKERESIRDLVLEEFFGQASGSDIFDRIPAARRTDVHAVFLDRLTVQGMLDAMSDDFGRTLRARVPAPKGKSNKLKFKTIHDANYHRVR